MTLDYKTYSLNQLKDWVHDAISSGDVSATEVYNAITSVVEEQIDYHTQNLSNLRELHSLLNGKNDKEDYDAVMREKEYYEPSMPLWGHSDMEALVCNSNSKSEDCKKAWNDFWEENYYPEEHRQYTEEELNAMCDAAEDKVNKWVLPVELSYVDGVEDYLLSLPNDLLNTVGWKEGDQLEWVPQNDNSYILKKVTNEN